MNSLCGYCEQEQDHIERIRKLLLSQEVVAVAELKVTSVIEPPDVFMCWRMMNSFGKIDICRHEMN